MSNRVIIKSSESRHVWKRNVSEPKPKSNKFIKASRAIRPDDLIEFLRCNICNNHDCLCRSPDNE